MQIFRKLKSVKEKFLGNEPTENYSKTPEYCQLIKNINNTKSEIRDLNQKINFVTDPILLNQLIFQLKSVEVRYQYWFCLAKDLKIIQNANK